MSDFTGSWKLGFGNYNCLVEYFFVRRSKSSKDSSTETYIEFISKLEKNQGRYLASYLARIGFDKGGENQKTTPTHSD